MEHNFYPLYTGGSLHPDSIKQLKKASLAESKPISEIPLQEFRDNFFESAWMGKPDPNVTITEQVFCAGSASVPVRIYKQGSDKLKPVTIFFHGGGFAVGRVNDYDSFCTYLAAGTGSLVISVDYRLSPENKFPAAVEDAITVLRWLKESHKTINGDIERISVIGDSAGGNLSAVLSILARDNDLPKIKAQILICPWVDLSCTTRASYKYFGSGLWLSKDSIEWFIEQYVNDEDDLFNYLCSPMHTENFTGQPKTLIINAEFDVLKDEAEEYAFKLKEAGVEVKYSLYKGMLHDFVVLPGLFSTAKDAVSEICEFIKETIK